MSFYDHEPPDSEEDEAVVAQVDKTSTVVRTRTRTTPDSIGHENDTTTTSPRSLEFVNTSAPSDTEPLSSPTKRRRLTFTQPHDDVHEDSPASASPADFYSPVRIATWPLGRSLGFSVSFTLTMSLIPTPLNPGELLAPITSQWVDASIQCQRCEGVGLRCSLLRANANFFEFCTGPDVFGCKPGRDHRYSRDEA